jgi:hypothetical protein
MVHVDSEAITDVEYEEETRELDVTFTGGRIYRYFDVPPETHADFMNAESMGAFLNQRIKPVFSFAEVTKKRRSRLMLMRR